MQERLVGSAALDIKTKKISSPEALEEYRKSLMSEYDPEASKIIVCCGTGCRPSGSVEVAEELRKALAAVNWNGKVVPAVKATGCHGFCSRGPIVEIEPQGIFYQKVKTKDVQEIVEKTIVGGELIKRLQYKDSSKTVHAHTHEIPFYAKQDRLVLKNIGRVDPFDINDSVAVGAYGALAKALTQMTPAQLIEEVKISGLKGRGGAGFPTGVKWESCASQKGEKYIICNADEGDPGAFMDRSLLEGDPHGVLEGMAIAALAIGSNRGYFYVRLEYPLAINTLRNAIRQAEELGLLGDNIMGTGFNFNITLSMGAGAFVCGESSALMSSLEGKVGRPRAKYIRSVEKGFRDSPSNLNNVETYGNIPAIIANGGEWYRGMGTKESTGTKVFSLTGNVNNIGLVEVPMGIPLREIIFEIGGGIPKKRKFKAVQTGGPSGGCIPEAFLDIPVSFESLAEVGSIMGSGGMIVMDENICMVEVARYFTNFLVEESCGQCAPCRESLIRMLEILNRITKGEGREEDIALLQELGKFITDYALCGLGTSAANPVLSTIRYFREEYETHIRQKKCEAGVCKTLYSLEISAEACKGCGICKKACPADAITGEKKQTHVINNDQCIKCMECFKNCEFNAIEVK
jgi:NADH:ubiquinone oxidoreductase subunit F (NADH-binding)/(2Fe-2S) ferredoxin/NAD-dependent dihydropyrimidine dehydrogenase PreA subunit